MPIIGNMANPSTRARPPLEFIPPDLDPLVLRVCQFLLPLWLRTRTGLREIDADGLEILLDVYQRFSARKIRLLLAFRHPSVNDPYVMAYLFWKLLPSFARKSGLDWKSPAHAHFIYDRGIPLWAGAAVGRLFAKLGGTSLQRGKTDLPGLRSARRLLLEADRPLAAAPEGATNGHNEIVSPLEPGISQLAFWCADDLRKAGRDEDVYILPIGIRYFYISPLWSGIERTLANLEAEVGLAAATAGPGTGTVLYDRLFRLGETLLSRMEDFYREFYFRVLPTFPDDGSDPNSILSRRLANLLDAALQVAEEYFHLQAGTSAIDRCRRLEQAGWDRIYREELRAGHSLSPVERSLADRIAAEANYRLWHMRIVESFVAVTGRHVKEKPTVERFAETLSLLQDLVRQIRGGDSFFRPPLGQQKVKIAIGEPLSISARYSEYRSDRRGAVTRLTADLQSALENSIPRD